MVFLRPDETLEKDPWERATTAKSERQRMNFILKT
jgi:hypothetical protein